MRFGARFAALTGIVLILGIGMAPVPAATPETSFSRSPDRGPRGTVVKVSGSGCTDDGQPWEAAYVLFYSDAKKADGTTAYSYYPPDRFPVHDDGSWEGEFTVPADAPLGGYTLSGNCEASDMDRRCGQAPFTVTDASAPTTAPTTTAPPPTTTTPGVTTTTTSTTARSGTGTAVTTTSVSTTTSTTTESTLPDDGKDSAAPAGASRHDDGDGDGTPWGWTAVGVTAAGCGARAAQIVRRRRRAIPAEVPREAT